MNRSAASSKTQDKIPEGTRTFNVSVPYQLAMDALTIKQSKVVKRKADWIQVTDGGALIGWVEDYDNISRPAWAYGVGAWLKVVRV